MDDDLANGWRQRDGKRNAAISFFPLGSSQEARAELLDRRRRRGLLRRGSCGSLAKEKSPPLDDPRRGGDSCCSSSWRLAISRRIMIAPVSWFYGRLEVLHGSRREFPEAT